MIKIAIVEDNQQNADILIDYLARYQMVSGYRFKLTHFSDGEEIVQIEKNYFDLILMDIEMERMNGIDAAKKVRLIDEDVIIMFITQAPQYAVQGFEVNALDYVLKPINYYAFTQRIARALERLSRRKQKTIVIESGSFVKNVLLSKIKYIEIMNHEARYYLMDQIITIRESLKTIEAKLQDHRFFKCNQSYIVNFDYIDAIEGSELKIGEVRIPLSRSKKKLFLDRFNNYINEVSK